mmetsp:Transcript_47370/g.118325  ORF Transcript_47370/g.118325 Transcript_47370/m.118325 type:complete len:143 (+) Transcript_47370:483-911(+)
MKLIDQHKAKHGRKDGGGHGVASNSTKGRKDGPVVTMVALRGAGGGPDPCECEDHTPEKADIADMRQLIGFQKDFLQHIRSLFYKNLLSANYDNDDRQCGALLRHEAGGRRRRDRGGRGEHAEGARQAGVYLREQDKGRRAS